MSGLGLRAAYQHNQPEFGVPGVVLVNATNSPTFYQLKPSDFLILVDLNSYGAGPGPDVRFSSAQSDAAPITIRNILGSGATANWSITAPAALTGGFEDANNPTNFNSSVPITVPNYEGTWVYDRARSRLVLLDPDTSGGGGAPVILNGITTDTSSHILQTIALPAPPSVTSITVEWLGRDNTLGASGGGQTKAVFTNAAGPTSAQLGTNTTVEAKGAGSITLAAAAAGTYTITANPSGGASTVHWTFYVTTQPNTT